MAGLKRRTKRNVDGTMAAFDGKPMETYFSLLRENTRSKDNYTERDYRQHITSVARLMQGRPQTEDEERTAIREYITAGTNKSGKPLSNVTRNRRLTYLRTYTAWLVQAGYRSAGYKPTDGIKRRKEQERPRTFEPKAVADLIEALKREAQEAETWDSLRNLVTVMTMALCGLRKCEIRALKPGNVAIKEKRIYVHSPKTDLTRAVGIPATLLPWLKDLIDEREALVKAEKFIPATHPDARLFCGPRGKELSEAGLSHAWQRAGRKYAPEGARMYDLRHFFGTTLGEACDGVGALNPKEIMIAMGHTDIRTSMKYTHPNPEKVAMAAREKMENVLSTHFENERPKGKGQQAKTEKKRGRTLVAQFDESSVHQSSPM